MIEELDDDLPASGAADGASWAVLGRASRDKADAYLDEQTSLVRLQKEHLHEQRLLLLSHLKWRHFDDQLKGALQIMLVVLGAAFVIAVGAAVWNASQADGLVIQSFSVPPSFTQAGLTGEVVADDITGKLSAVRRFAMDHSFSTSKDVTKDGENEIRVEIPEAGISLSEVLRYLRAWLGHERHATGNLRDVGDGRVALSVSVAGLQPVSVTGNARDLDRMETEAAEAVFAEIDPVNIVNYLATKGRTADAFAAAARYIPIAQTRIERANSYGLWSYTTLNVIGDFRLAIARALTGVAIDPSLAVTHAQLIQFYSELGWDEKVLHEAEAILPLRVSDQPEAHRAHGFAEMQAYALSAIARLRGDFASAWGCRRTCTEAQQLLSHANMIALQHEPGEAFRLIDAADAAGSADPADRAQAQYTAEAARGNWRAAKANAVVAGTVFATANVDVNPRWVATTVSTRFAPLVALADAHLGAFAAAHHMIDGTPGDCYECVHARGEIDRLDGHDAGATFWFARAVAQGPSIPFADTDWGAMLLHRGDYDGAIAKFAQAHAKGPHFADPLEMWGEALMQKNRSDIALPIFAEAAQYAPNWGRLHLKWGEALFYTGHKDEARKQFDIAAHLDLSAADKTALTRWTHG